MVQFGRGICGNLATAEQREWLVTNGIGGYGCGTLASTLTRHYHGLLVAALRPPLERTLLLTKLDEQVQLHGHTYALHADRWPTGVTPHGYRHIERFTLEGTVPCWTYALANALLEKRVWMEQGANTTYVRYTLARGGPVQLTLKALLNYRDHHGSTHSRSWHFDIQPVTGGIQATAFPDAVPVYVRTDCGPCAPQHQWYADYTLAVEQYRGIDPTDNHLHAATFTAQLAPGQSLTLTASTEPAVEIDGALERQRQHEQSLLAAWEAGESEESPPWLRQLVLAADQFVVARPLPEAPDGKTLIAGYPWFGDWGRDTMIALPGIALATQRPHIARPILRTFAQYLDQGMLPNLFPEVGSTPEYNTVDAILWYFEAVRAYVAATDDRALLAELFPALADVIAWHQRGTRYRIHLAADGLIYAGEPGVQLTWMDAKVNDWVVTPRIGKPVEINALWYNALLIMAQFAQQLGQPAAKYRELAEHTRQGFQRFWQPQLGHCCDVLDGPDGDDPSLRPNQIFAVSLAYSNLGLPLLARPQQQAIVDTVAQHLLTSHGLRSLAPTHPDYRGHYGGDRLQRDGSYHQGTVWGWLIGPFVQAHLQVYRDSAAARRCLEPMADHLATGCVGSLSEIFDGEPPFAPRGAFAQAWSVAEVLRAWRLTVGGG